MGMWIGNYYIGLYLENDLTLTLSRDTLNREQGSRKFSDACYHDHLAHKVPRLGASIFTQESTRAMQMLQKLMVQNPSDQVMIIILL